MSGRENVFSHPANKKGVLHMTETFTLYKLIILYMLEKVDFPLTNGQISEFILDKGIRITSHSSRQFLKW